MQPLRTITSRIIPLPRNDIDTDQIIPARYLKVTDKFGLADGLFFGWRYLQDGSPDTDFPLNRPEYQGAEILLAGDNFGCGSSREHAPWALEDYGFRVIIAPSFADIFFNNSFKNGLLPIVLSEEIVDCLFRKAMGEQALSITVDLTAQNLILADGEEIAFEVDPFRKHCLLEGLDDIGLTLQHVDEIKAYEEKRRAEAPWLF